MSLRPLAHLGREEPVITRIGVGAADLVDLHEMVRRDHPRVLRVELPADLLPAAILVEPVDPVGHDEVRAVVPLRHEVAERQADGPREADRLPVPGRDGEVAIGRFQPLDVAIVHRRFDLRERGARQSGLARSHQIHQAFHTSQHVTNPHF